jgi:hypothetical protein
LQGEIEMKYLLLLLCLAPVNVFAILPEPLPSKTGIGLLKFGTEDYRLGDEWGKRPVTAENLAKESLPFQRAAYATARVGGATGFFLGKFNGQYVVATNYHVYSSDRSCRGANIRFPLLGVQAQCDQFLGAWSDVDLALFTVRVASAQDGEKLEKVGKNFSFRGTLEPGQTLITIGFGVAGNDQRQLMANQDSDCYVFSGSGNYRFMADPDRWNPGPYRAWSFSLGCDVSHGDSGSAIVDRKTGNVVGIIWTGRIPKSETAQSSTNLKQMFFSQDEAIWQELSYAVPAEKIGEHLEKLLESSLPENTKATLRALLQ